MLLKERETEAAVPLKGKEKEQLELDGDEIDKNKGLTDEEVEEVDELLQEGFAHWSKKDFLGAGFMFVRAVVYCACARAICPVARESVTAVGCRVS